MKKIRSTGILFIFFLSTLFLQSVSVHATTTLFVGGSGPGNYTSIQEAVDSANRGDQILVAPGIYLGPVTITKNIQLIGQQRDQTIIKGNQTGSVITLTANNVTLAHLSITGSGRKFPDAGISIKSSYNTIVDNNLTDNYYGLCLLDKTSYNMISENHIKDNHQCGVYFSRSSYNNLTQNYVENQPFNGFGLYESSNNNFISNNTLSHNHFCGVNIRDSFDNTITNNRFIGNIIGLHVPPPDYRTMVNGNSFSDNGISLEEEYDLTVFALITVVIALLLGFLVVKKKFF
jgi:parallel beta-helix repeat protein